MRRREICEKCSLQNDCEFDCPALERLKDIHKETRNKERHQLIKKLQKELNLLDAEPSKEMRKLAEKIIDKFEQLHFIREYDIKIGYVLSQEKPPGPKIKYADCRKVKLLYQAWLPFDFIITFYDRNVELLNENQKKILMLHELRHIGIGERGYKIEEHEIEDFESILRNYGITWNAYQQEVPDILSEDNMQLSVGE